MTFDPFETSDTAPVKSLADVLAWLTTTEGLESTTRQAYRLAVEWAARTLHKLPCEIPADKDAVLSNFRDEAYTKERAKTFEAYKRKRRNLSCAIGGATGAIAARRERRARADDWSALIHRVKLLTEEGRGLPGLHVKALIALDVLADHARVSGLVTQEICTQTVRQLETNAPGLGETLQKACDILDRLPSLNDALLDRLLPSGPIRFRPRPKRETFLLPDPLEEELSIWVVLATKGDWVEVDGDFNSDTGAAPYRTAARKVISTALDIGCVDLGRLATIASCFEKGIVVQVVKAWRQWELEGHPRAIKSKTARNYLEKLKMFLQANGEDAGHVREILAKSKWLKSPTPHEGKMPQRTRSFCRHVVRDMEARVKFLSRHVHFRKLASAHLKAIAREPDRVLYHTVRARQFGTMAAFAALMTDAVPARIGSVLPATFRGTAPWLALGRGPADDGYLCVPPGHTKNGKGITAPIAANSQFRGLSTLRWYERVIRPLFPHHDKNDFFFPAIENADAPLGYNTFMSWWSAAIADAGFPGMTPHMFRHGQVSILIANMPGDWATAAARIGDKETTVREYYAWVDEERLILEGQQRLAEAFFHAA